MLKRKIGRLFIGCLGICSCLLSSSPVFATEGTTANMGTDATTNDYQIQGVDYPALVHNVATDGAYFFHGSQEKTDLYTNYLITGKSSYQVVVKNNSDTEDLYLKILGKKERVAAGTTLVFSVNTSASKKFPIFFYSPCYFEGNIG